VVVPGVAHHVTQRGNHQQEVFYTESDRAMYLKLLKEHAARHDLRIVGYCLMTNHVHLVVIPGKPQALAAGLGRTHNDYSRWLQIRRGQCGHLWQNRFFSCPLEDAHLEQALRYVELNPVRARLVERAWDWPWSSANAHCGAAEDLLLDRTWWRDRYTSASWLETLEIGCAEAALAQRIREATRTGRPFGSGEFVQALEQKLGRVIAIQKRGPKQRRIDDDSRQTQLAIT
jgi:putative transposase